MTLPFVDVAGLTVVEAADALEAALSGGLDPEAAPPRAIVPVGEGDLLVMPAAVGGHAAVKLVTVGPGEPRVQGVCVLFDAETLAPVALLDGIALTNLRTAAVSALAVRRLAAPDARRLLVFGRGPQGRAHAEAVQAIRPIEHVDVLGRDAPDRDELVAAADVICCCTTAREPLFDGALVAAHACVVAIGSHEPGARELDDRLVARATVVVESRAAALREAGDVLAAGLVEDDLVTLRELVAGFEPPPGRPRLFKSVGMAWEDTVVAAAVFARTSTSTALGRESEQPMTEVLELDTPHGPARVHLRHAENPRAALVLGHGAGGGVNAPDLVTATKAANDAQVSVALVEQPYRVAGRRSSPAPRQLDAAWIAVVEQLPFDTVITGGRSAGARVACRTAAQTDSVGVLCLAFPLLPPRAAPEKTRQGELDGVTVPVLVVQGESDRFGMPSPGPTREVVTVAGDHGLKKDGERIATSVGDWLDRLVT